MATMAKAVEGAMVIGGLALELGGHAAKALCARALKFAEIPGGNTESIINRGAESLNKAKDWISERPMLLGGAAFGLGALCAAHCRFWAGRNK
jgi:hypothetical protein